jgi:predicted GNAT superfamily acetyltransferase
MFVGLRLVIAQRRRFGGGARAWLWDLIDLAEHSLCGTRLRRDCPCQEGRR